jgi:hypothetical protein
MLTNDTNIHIVCININVQCIMIIFGYIVYTTKQVSHPVVSVPSIEFMEMMMINHERR